MSVQFITEDNRKIYAILDYDFYLELMEAWEDMDDIKVAHQRRNEPTIPLEKLKKELLANPIRKIREKKGLTQKELAKKMDVTQGYIARIEGDQANPSIKTIRKVAQALGCDVKDLIV